MNYIKELNAFYNQIIFNPLSSSAVALWHTLIHFNNLCGWKQEFSVAATQLQLKAGLKSTSFKRAREELQKGGWIQVKSLGANRAAVYQMISQQIQFEQNNPSETSYPNLSSNIPSQQHAVDNTASTHPVDQSQNEEAPHQSNSIEMITSDVMTVNRTDHNPDHTTVDSVAHCKDYITGHSTDHTTAPFFKQDNTKQNINKNQTTIADAIRFYQDNFERVTPFISEDILEWINDMGEPLILYAMKLSLEQGKTTWRYVKGILKAWAKKEITTLEAAKAEETAYHNRRTQKSQQGYKPHHAEIVPDWFTERKRQEHSVNQVRHNTLRDHNQNRAEEENELKELLAEYA